MKYLDYIYYRVTKAYMKWGWDSSPKFTGAVSVSLVVTMLFVNLYGVIHLTFFFEKYVNSYKEQAKIGGLVLSVLVLIYFSIRYHGRYDLLKKRWRNETKKTKIHKWTFCDFSHYITNRTAYYIFEFVQII